MALRAERQEYQRNCDFIMPFHCERGGIVSVTSLSGISYATYNPQVNASTLPLGILLYDYEEVLPAIAIIPSRTRRAYPEFSPANILLKGTVITNFVAPEVGAITPGTFAFLAPSGLITPSEQYGGVRVGKFMSAL
jgi:hypothetical protein